MKLVKWMAVVVCALNLAACGSMPRSQRDAGIGAVAGGALGYLVTGGPVGTIGGAAIGGVIGAMH